MRDRNPKSMVYPDAFPKEKWEVKWFLLVSALMCFLWNNLWSVSHYMMGPFNGWWRQGGNGQHYLAAPIWIYRSGIGDHRFKILMDLLPNYTFYTNLSILFIGYLLIEYVISLMTFNLWKICNIVWCRFNPLQRLKWKYFWSMISSFTPYFIGRELIIHTRIIFSRKCHKKQSRNGAICDMLYLLLVSPSEAETK